MQLYGTYPAGQGSEEQARFRIEESSVSLGRLARWDLRKENQFRASDVTEPKGKKLMNLRLVFPESDSLGNIFLQLICTYLDITL